MDEELQFFLDKKPRARELYRGFKTRLLQQLGQVGVTVQKTQISFANKYNFAFVSCMKLKGAAAHKEGYIVVTFGLGQPVHSPRIAVATEAYPGRWTHHVLIARPEEVDDELMAWVGAAADFSANKR